MSEPFTGIAGRGRGRPPYLPVTVVIAGLSVALVAVIGTYWSSVLAVRLTEEARSQAEVLARSQATLLATALRGGDRVRRVGATLDELLLLRDPKTGTSFFDSVELEVDYETVPAERGSLDLRRGDEADRGGFHTEVAVYDPETFELLAIARFQVSDRFSRQLNADTRSGLIGVTLAVLALLLLGWGVLMLLLRQLHRQVSRRLRAERELFHQEQKHQRLVDNLSSYFVYSKDAEGRLESVSESVRRVLGYAPEEVMERYGARLAGLPSSEPGAEASTEVELSDREGRPRFVELSEVAVIGNAGVDAVDGIAHDVTVQRAVQEELRLAKDQAEEASRAKSQFLANVSHEIRTPLNAILGMTTLASKTKLDERQRAYLDKIAASGRLLLDLIEDILDLSRIEAGRLRVRRVELDLDELLAEVADAVVDRAREKGLTIRFATRPDVPRGLLGDPVRLKQVLLNLLNNALKFTQQGEIGVEVSRLDTLRERVSLQFSVRDTGIGIDKKHLPTLFDPFTQVDATTTRRFGGVGLGLAISRRLVHMMGGELAVESALGEGSTFTFTAELGVAATAEPPRPRRANVRFSAGQRVLLVEDHPISREVAREMLAAMGLEVTEASNAPRALECLREGTFDAVLMDVQMPEMGGLEAVRRIRARAELVDLPVFAMTAHAMLGDRERFLGAGMTEYIAKPLDEHRLFEILSRHLGTEIVEARTPIVFPTDEGVPGFDVADGLHRLGGNLALYRRLVGQFVAENFALAAELRRLLAEDRRSDALARLHTVKGTAGAVSARRVAAAVAAVETGLRDRGLLPALDELESALVEAQTGALALDSQQPAETADSPGCDGERTSTALETAAALRSLLVDNDLAATRAFDELAGLLQGSVGEPMRRLARCLDDLDFDGARHFLEEIERSLQSSGGA